MDINISINSSYDMQQIIDSKTKLSTEESKIDGEFVESTNNEEKNLKDKVEISTEGMKKSKEAESENNLPESIQRINEQIKRIQAQIAEVKVKLEEIDNSELSEELKDKQKELYNDQLMELNSALVGAYNELKKALREEKIDDQSMVAAALIFS